MMSQNYDGPLQNNTPGFCRGWNVHRFLVHESFVGRLWQKHKMLTKNSSPRSCVAALFGLF